MNLRTRAAVAATKRVAGLRALPTATLLALAEIGMMARGHLMRLSPQERRRLFELMRRGRGRPSRLRQGERDELAGLLAKLEPRILAGDVVKRVSPVPLPRRVLYGSAGRARRG